MSALPMLSLLQDCMHLQHLIHLIDFVQGQMWRKVRRPLQTQMSLLINAVMTCKAYMLEVMCRMCSKTVVPGPAACGSLRAYIGS